MPTHKRSFAAEEAERRKKTSPAKRIIVGIVVVIAIAVVGYVVYERFAPDKQPVQDEKPFIAVLPFDNISGDENDEYFSDGITTDIIAYLQHIREIDVMAWGSVKGYKDTEKSRSDIEEELKGYGVTHIVEGTVNRPENEVRIIPTLVEITTGKVSWTLPYNRQGKGTLSIQSEIASEIADELEIVLSPTEREFVEEIPTENQEANDNYLRGNDYEKRSGAENWRIAIKMYQIAIDLDPAFALAYAKLSMVQSRMYWYNYDRSEECLTEAKEAVDNALLLNPELPEAHLAMGYYYFRCHLDYESALKKFAIAQKSQPNNSDLLAAIGYVQRRQGKFEQALANIKKASELDPLSQGKAKAVGDSYNIMRNYPEAERYYERAISLAPDIPGRYSTKAMLYIRWEGNTEKARAVLDESPLNIDSTENPLINTFITLDVYDGKYQEALDRLSSKPEDIDGQNSFIPIALRYANIYRYMNKKELAQAYYDSARVILESKKMERPKNERLRSSLGITYAGLGRKQEAISEGKLGMELYPVSKHKAWVGLRRVEDMACIYVMVGEYDNAINQLEFLLSNPGTMTVHVLRLDPIWAPLRDHPRFQKLLDKYDITDN
jgi:TolB-like protein